ELKIAVGNEPRPDAAQDFEGLTEEEGDFRVQGDHMPDDQDDHQQQYLPESQAGRTSFDLHISIPLRRARPRARVTATSGTLLLGIALEHFFAQHRPYGSMQFHKARMGAHFGHIAGAASRWRTRR